MELRRRKLAQELREAREDLLNINFATDTTSRMGVSRPYALIDEWFINYVPTFRKLYAYTNDDGRYNEGVLHQRTNGYQQETDQEIFNELRSVFVEIIDGALSRLDQDVEVESLLEGYIKRVKDTKLAELLKEFNIVKDVAPNHAAMGFRTILCLVIQEKAKRVNSMSKTATRADLAVDEVIRDAKTDGTLSGDERRFVTTFVSMHKDIYDLVVHRPGANNMVDKSEVDAMVDLLNKLLPAIIN